jgi:hypothetical protein
MSEAIEALAEAWENRFLRFSGLGASADDLG